MADVSSNTNGVTPHLLAKRVRPQRGPVYIAIGALAIITAVAGFWPKYFGPFFAGTLQTIPMIHVHAAVFVGWLLIVVAQAWFAASGRLALHRKVGNYGMYWGLLVIAVGLITAFKVFGDRVATGNLAEANIKLFVPLTDLAVFIPFFVAAWVYRHRPELHKRFIIVATTILLIAAVHRIRFLGGPPPPVPRLLAVWLAPIYIAMAYDWFRQRTVHWIYLLGIAAVLFLKFGRVGMAKSQAWADLAAWFARFYQ
jgi:hypothetical protein